MYLSIIKGNIGFKYPNSPGILSTDIAISDEIYYKFFEMLAKGIKYTIKDLHGLTFDDIFQIATSDSSSSDIKILQDQLSIVNAKLITAENQVNITLERLGTINDTLTQFIDYMLASEENLIVTTESTSSTLNEFIEFACSAVPELQ